MGRSISWLQMAKNVLVKSFYLFYKVNCFFLVIEQSYSLQKIWTLKKRIIITLRKFFSRQAPI